MQHDTLTALSISLRSVGFAAGWGQEALMAWCGWDRIQHAMQRCLGQMVHSSLVLSSVGASDGDTSKAMWMGRDEALVHERILRLPAPCSLHTTRQSYTMCSITAHAHPAAQACQPGTQLAHTMATPPWTARRGCGGPNGTPHGKSVKAPYVVSLH